MSRTVQAWAVLVREALVQIATTWDRVVTYGELSKLVDYGSPRMSGVLEAVEVLAAEKEEPMWTSLVVLQERGVVDEKGFADAVLLRHGARPSDAESVARSERLKCYRLAGAIVPEGAEPKARKDKKAQREAERARWVPPLDFGRPM